MKFLRKFVLSILPLASFLFFSSAAQSQDGGWTVTYEGNFVSDAPFTALGLKLYNGATISVDLVTNDKVWQFREGKDVVITGLWTFFESDNDFRLIAQDVRPMMFMKGTLESAFGIGGESTGHALRLENGRTVELDLRTNSLAKEFVPGRAIEVRGYYTVIQAVESRRVVLIVNQVKPVL